MGRLLLLLLSILVKETRVTQKASLQTCSPVIQQRGLATRLFYKNSSGGSRGVSLVSTETPFKLALIFIIQTCINQLQLLKTYFVLLYIHFLIN